MWVLQTAYFNYRQQYGPYTAPINVTIIDKRKYRYTAYRQLSRWCWGWLGRVLRVVLPSCAVNKLRLTFSDPSNTYTGFKYPTID
uniref:P2X purinoreceptor 7 intracellular domain-containing protein n=1 Tax=Amphimedon queenslandica TaxID=400682 RepID=A0A1X7SM35_AMPQE